LKSQLLQILRTAAKAVPEEKMASELGISTASVLTAVLELQDNGYHISVTAAGIHLEQSPEAPFPWEFSGRESKIHYYQELPSTMDKAKALAFAGCPDFTTIIAEQQTKGRGRLQRIWQSARGGLYFTIVLRPDLPPALSYRVNFAATIVLAQVLQEMFKIDARVKWPNDILVAEQKLCGMLSELETEDQRISFVNLGIGLNVNNDPEIVEPRATSLKKILGQDVSRKEILAKFLNAFEEKIHGENLDTIISEWKEYTVTLNRQVKIVTINGQFEGFARDVDENGALVLELADGRRKKVIYGDCFH